ncbi:MAG: poly-gamma-glutamate biosynthesis protein PgsC/CapC [Ruminococcus sp.]|nr:poly-gamma-glutamate biosynthesis protein PgsC/CapC [Ruminococcus sp.]
MTFRRILFTYGILALVAGLFLIVRTAYINSKLKLVPATVTEITQESVTFKHSDGSTEERMMDVVNAEYRYKDSKGTVLVVPQWSKGLSHDDIKKLKKGDEIELYFDPFERSVASPEGFTLGIIQCAISAAMIYIGIKGAKGYKAEFFERYKKAFLTTMFLSGVVLGYAVYEEFFYSPGGMMPGIAALGAFLWMFGFMAIALIAEIIVWSVSVAGYKKKERQLNEQQ